MCHFFDFKFFPARLLREQAHVNVGCTHGRFAFTPGISLQQKSLFAQAPFQDTLVGLTQEGYLRHGEWSSLEVLQLGPPITTTCFRQVKSRGVLFLLVPFGVLANIEDDRKD